MARGSRLAPQEIVDGFVRVFTQGDFVGAAARLSEDVVWKINAVDLTPGEPTFVGPASVADDLFALVASVLIPQPSKSTSSG